MANNPDKSTGGQQGNRNQGTDSGNDSRLRTDFGRKEDFGDDYEVKQEDKMTEDEARTEKGNRPQERPDRH